MKSGDLVTFCSNDDKRKIFSIIIDVKTVAKNRIQLRHYVIGKLNTVGIGLLSNYSINMALNSLYIPCEKKSAAK